MLLPIEEVCLPNGEIADTVLALAVRMIQEESCNGLCVNDLVKATNLPRRTLERRFQKYLHTSPHTEILKVQLQRAHQLLTESRLKLVDVAQQAGFRSVSHLCVAVKRHFRKTPNEIRQANLRYFQNENETQE